MTPVRSAAPIRQTFAVAVIAATLTACSSKPPATSTGEAPPEQVQGIVHVCSSCHGMGGHSISPTFPRLAGQQAGYLEAQLKAFHDHTRADPHALTYMWGMAAQLTDPLIKGIATYYSMQAPVPGTPQDPGEMAAGQRIFVEGLPDRDVPACQGCHGEKAEGMDAIPRLAGQHREYLQEQLRNFASNARANEVMHANSAPLNPAEISAITAYLAAQ
ncbi:cytochrome c [Aliidongia dinghuensis]|uniref:Cytochrome c n=1 Tax=Aliidongia dinghuensis TaxID=1867774 RepID=A0A8J2YVD2_9PROT|nr:c-type cytochrome [Aliidongia dinghuensis]GGF26851.1 cytochrome c [Aliidongia dinghuensis]